MWCLLLLQSTDQSAEVQLLQLQGKPAQLWLTGSVAPQHVGSSQTRDHTNVPVRYLGRQILNHWTTKEASYKYF